MSMFVNLFKFIFVRSKRYKISIAKIEKDTFMNKNYLLRPNRKHINYVLHIRLKIDDVGDFRFSMNANPTVDGYLNIMPTSINIRYYFLMVFFNNLSLNPDFNAWLKKQYDSYLKGKFKSEIYFDSYRFYISKRTAMEIADPELLYTRIMDEEDLAIMKEKQELEDVKYKYMPDELKAKIKQMEKDERARKEKKIQSLINQSKIAKGEKIAENELEAKLAEESISTLDDEAIQKLKLIEKMNGNLSDDSKDFEKKKLKKEKLESNESIDWVKLSLFVGSLVVFIILVLLLLRVFGIFDILGIF